MIFLHSLDKFHCILNAKCRHFFFGRIIWKHFHADDLNLQFHSLSRTKPIEKHQICIAYVSHQFGSYNFPPQINRVMLLKNLFVCLFVSITQSRKHVYNKCSTTPRKHERVPFLIRLKIRNREKFNSTILNWKCLSWHDYYFVQFESKRKKDKKSKRREMCAK